MSIFEALYAAGANAALTWGKLDRIMEMTGCAFFIECLCVRGCHDMSLSDFIIKNETLVKYVGPGGNVTIPAGVTKIGLSAFQSCSGLTSITIPDSVTKICGSAFECCKNLISVSIPKSVNDIESWAFRRCMNLADSDGFVIINGILFDYYGPGGDVHIPKRVTRIGSRAFEALGSLNSVTIPESVASIDEGAFGRCSGLVNVEISHGVEQIGSNAFNRCTSLSSVTIPESVTSIGFNAFDSCSSLTTIALPKSMTKIEAWAFMFCGRLTSISIPEGVTSIGKNTFYECRNLADVVIPESVESIGDWAFYNCASLVHAKITARAKSISDSAFEGCSKLQWVSSPFVLKPARSNFALLLRGDKPKYLAYSAKASGDNLSDYAKPGSWSNYDLELINNGPVYKHKLPARLLGALGRLLDPVELTEENRARYAEMLNKNAKKLVPLAEETGDVGIISSLFDLSILDEKTKKAVKKLLAAATTQELRAFANM